MSLTLRYVLDKRAKRENGVCPLKLRIIYNRTSAHISTGFYMQEKDWDVKNDQVKSSAKFIENIQRFNNDLINERAATHDAIYELIADTNSNYSASELKAKILNKEVSQDSNFFDFLSQQINDLRSAKRIGTADSYNDLYNKIKVLEGGGLKLRIQEIDYKFLILLEKTHLAKGSNIGSLGVYMRTLRAVYNKAIKSGIVDKESYPFTKYTIKKSDPERSALSIDDLKKLMAQDLSKREVLDRSRNLYLFSFFMQGINWKDMSSLKGENISRDKLRLSYVRDKTGKRYNVKLFPEVIKLIEQMSGKEIGNIQKDEYLLPIMSKEFEHRAVEHIRNRRKKLNNYLKEISKLVKIDSFTIYSARHTWATLQKYYGTPTAVIQEGLGHTTEQMTQTYLKGFGNDVLDEYNRGLFDSLNKPD